MKKVIIALSILIIVLAAVMPSHNSKKSSLDKISVDITKSISLNFESYKVSVDSWDSDFVMIKTNMEQDHYASDINGNVISIKQLNKEDKKNISTYSSFPWASLMQFDKYRDLFFEHTPWYDFTIYVPKNVPIEIVGNHIRTNGCTVSLVKGNEAVLRDGIIAKGFKEDVKSLTVRDCKIPKDIKFENKPGEIRDNTYMEN